MYPGVFRARGRLRARDLGHCGDVLCTVKTAEGGVCGGVVGDLRGGGVRSVRAPDIVAVTSSSSLSADRCGSFHHWFAACRGTGRTTNSAPALPTTLSRRQRVSDRARAATAAREQRPRRASARRPGAPTATPRATRQSPPVERARSAVSGYGFRASNSAFRTWPLMYDEIQRFSRVPPL